MSFRLILASVTTETGAPDLVISDYAAQGLVLEAVAEQEALDQAELAALDEQLTRAVAGDQFLLTYEDGAVTVTFAVVVRL